MDELVTKFKMRPGNTWGCGVIITNSNGLFLVGKRVDNGLWGTPGGTCKVGETALDCIKRECFEESKVQLKDKDLRFIDVFIGPVGDRVWVSYAFIAKNIKVDEDQIKAQPSEIAEWKWVTAEELNKLKLFKPTKDSLELAKQKGFL